MSKLPLLATAIVLAMLSPAAAAQGASPQPATSEAKAGETSHASAPANREPVSAEDKAFLNYAAQDNQAEIDLCLVAEKQSGAPAVKAFSRLMVDDHAEVESQLASLIDSLGISTPNGMGKEGEQTMQRLQDLKGAAFDKAFLQAQVKDHTDDIEKYNKEIQSTHNEAIRRYAKVTVVTLDQHLEIAKAVQTAVKQEPSQTSAQK